MAERDAGDVTGKTGKRALRWAFCEPLHVGRDGSPYLDRLRIIQTPLFGVFLHRIHRPDIDRDPHDHPWWFASLVLAGGYTEMVWDAPQDLARTLLPKDVTSQWARVRVRNRWSLRTLGRSKAHIITEVRGILWTLILVGPRRKSWGFWTPDGWVGWKEYGANPDPLADGPAEKQTGAAA